MNNVFRIHRLVSFTGLFKLALIIMIMLCLSLLTHAQAFFQDALVAWSPDGMMIAVADETTLHIMDADTMTVLNTFTGLTASGSAWSPDGTMLAVMDGPDVQIWLQPGDPVQAELIATFQYYAPSQPPSSYIMSVAWSPDSTRVAASSGDFTRIWRVSTGELVHRLRGDWRNVLSLVWTPDNRLALTSIDSVAATLDPDSGEVINHYYQSSSDFPIDFAALAFSPDGNQAAIGTGYGGILIWEDTRTSELWASTVRPITTAATRHSEDVRALAWHPSGLYLASGGLDGTVRIWDPEAGELLEVIEVAEDAYIHSVAWRPGSFELAYNKPDGTVEVINPASVAVPPTTTCAATISGSEAAVQVSGGTAQTMCPGEGD